MHSVTYHFRFADGQAASLDAGPDAVPEPDHLPPWTALDFCQCPNCPLQRERVAHCPMALRFVPLIAMAGSLRSYEQLDVQVDTPERSFSKSTTVQRAIGSVMGLLAAASDCPRVLFLKPMAHFHLPFASE